MGLKETEIPNICTGDCVILVQVQKRAPPAPRAELCVRAGCRGTACITQPLPPLKGKGPFVLEVLQDRWQLGNRNEYAIKI